MSLNPNVSRRGERSRPLADPPPAEPRIRASLLALISAGLGVSMLAMFAGLFGFLNAPITLIGSGLFLLSATKFASFLALGARVRRKGAAPSSGERAELIEACTLGSLLAFVLSLALGRLVVLPRGLILLDWAVSVAAIGACQRRRPRDGRATEPDMGRIDAVVAAMIRDRCVFLAGGNREAIRALIDEAIPFGPEKVVLASRQVRDFPGYGRIVGRIALDATDALAVDEAIATARPDLVLFAPGRDDSLWEVALGSRRLVTASLRAGVGTIALILPREGSRAECLAERVALCLSGMTRSRLICVRIGDGVAPSGVAAGILGVAARARDGTVTTLGRQGLIQIQATSAIERNASLLWKELDRLEAISAGRRGELSHSNR